LREQPALHSEQGMSTPDRDGAINMLAYFWQEKGDIERWCGFDREHLAREFPAVLKAWDNYTASRAVLSAVIRDLERTGGKA
jgi:hypothetical protein